MVDEPLRSNKRRQVDTLLPRTMQERPKRKRDGEHSDELDSPTRKRKDRHQEQPQHAKNEGDETEAGQISSRKRKRMNEEQRDHATMEYLDSKRVREKDPVHSQYNDFNFWKVNLPPLDEDDMEH